MSSLSLLLWITLGVVIQLAVFLGIGFWRHWLEFQALRRTEPDLRFPMRASASIDADDAKLAAWSGFRKFRVDRKIIEDTAQSVCSFYLVPEDKQPLASFQPGQFLTFRLDVPAQTGVSEQIIRCYSLSDAPRSDYYRVSIKRVLAPPGSEVPAGRSSSFFHDHVDTGSVLQVRAPAGHFHIDRSEDPMVLIAGGIGITPMLSMVNWCLAEQPGREVWLFYGVRNGREMLMKSHLEALAAAEPNFHLRVCFSQPMPDDQAGRDYQHRGHIDVQLLRLELPLKPYHFYVCGPTPMMESLVPALADWGVPEDRIHFEAFGPASIKRRQVAMTAAAMPMSEHAERAIVVSFARCGKQLPWQSAAGSLLEFAEANGMAVTSGCRAGSCGSCQTTIQSGEVAYLQLPEYDPEPGTCLLCVSVPNTSVTLDL